MLIVAHGDSTNAEDVVKPMTEKVFAADLESLPSFSAPCCVFGSVTGQVHEHAMDERDNPINQRPPWCDGLHPCGFEGWYSNYWCYCKEPDQHDFRTACQLTSSELDGKGGDKAGGEVDLPKDEGSQYMSYSHKEVQPVPREIEKPPPYCDGKKPCGMEDGGNGWYYYQCYCSLPPVEEFNKLPELSSCMALMGSEFSSEWVNGVTWICRDDNLAAQGPHREWILHATHCVPNSRADKGSKTKGA
jgi:hypothetical protein